MALSRLEFEKSFLNEHNRRFRRALILDALANGPSWTEWSKHGKNQLAPNFYNDLAFVACYMIFRNKPTRSRLIQMRDFLWCRNDGNDTGFLADPMHQASDARKQVRGICRDASVEFSSAKKGIEEGTVVPDKIITNAYNAVYSEMWSPTGSMRLYILGDAHTTAMASLGANVGIINSDTAKSLWLDSLVKRFSGTGTMAKAYGQTFSTDDLGLTGSDTSLVIGGRRRVMVMGN